MSEQNRVPGPPVGRWIGFTLIFALGAATLLIVVGEPRNWPSTWTAWTLALSILAIVYAGLIRIEVTLATSAVGIQEARRTGSPKPDEPRRLRGWLLVYAAVCFPLVPLYIVVTKQKDDGDAVLEWFVLALLFAGVWVVLQISHVVRHDADAFGHALGDRRVQRVGVISAIFVALCGSYVVLTPAVFAQEAKVVRVIDGDTVDVRVDAGVRRIRVLNIDTPERVDPNKPVECLSKEATELTRSLLAEGQTVKLVYDRDRKDRYGRTLAHIELRDGRMLSTEIAKAGLGVPMVVGRNDARIGEIRDAFDAAAKEQHGFFDPNQKCTFAAQSTTATEAAATALKVDAGSTAADALVAATALAAVTANYQDLRERISSKSSLPIKAFLASSRAPVVGEVAGSLKTVAAREIKMRDVAAERKVAEQEAVKVAKKKAEKRKAAKLKAAKQKAAKQKAAAEERRRAVEAQRQKAVNPKRNVAPRRQAATNHKPRPTAPKHRTTTPKPRKTVPKKSGGKSSSGSKHPGYTGPRCYAPGGRTWHPC